MSYTPEQREIAERFDSLKGEMIDLHDANCDLAPKVETGIEALKSLRTYLERNHKALLDLPAMDYRRADYENALVSIEDALSMMENTP